MKKLTLSDQQLNEVDPKLGDNLAEMLSNFISDETGFCHKGFNFTIQVEARLDETE